MENLQPLLLSIGSNVEAEKHISAAKVRLKELLNEVTFSSVIQTEAIGKTAPNYLNCLAGATTSLDYDRLDSLLKAMEIELGRNRSSHDGCVAIDIDILELGNKRYHLRDWSRPYVQRLLPEMAAFLLR
jgi:2-amino-4-hydroxy-6-hydroxymethyldihydropteridine diphosphokinase